MIDRRLVAEMQTVREASTTQPRTLWNEAGHVFEVRNSGAVGVKRFRLDPALSDAELITIDLINTENTRSDPDASAGYVRLSNISMNYLLSIDGALYYLYLQFGTTDVNGFSSTNQFHVYEGETARGEIRGTMVPMWPPPG